MSAFTYAVSRQVIRLFSIISIVLLLGALVGVFTTRALPEEVKQETTLLGYEHEGTFDYLVHLKPSYLYGPEPEEPPSPPPNPKYPTEIIDSINMSFTYATTSVTPQQVEVTAVLENPELWQKKITLVTPKAKSGGFTIEFPLNLGDINKLFDTIDDEINIPSYGRSVTIVATVTAGADVFSQSLPMKLGQNLLEVDSNLAQSQGGSTGTFDYTINLKENSLYESKSLKPPVVTPYTPPLSSATLKPGQVVFTNLVENMDVNFSYQFKTSRPVNSLSSEVEIIAALQATSAEETELWSKRFSLATEKKQGEFNIGFPVDLVGYLELLDTIRKEIGTSAEAQNIVINARVHTVAETSFGLIDETFEQVLKGAIKGSVVEWDPELAKTQPGAITTSQMVPNPNKYLGLSVGAARNLSTVLAGIFGLFLLGAMALYVVFRPEGISPLEKEALRAGKKYGERMAEATSQSPMAGDKAISLTSMEDLIKVADELGKPVIHQAPAAPGEQHAYYVFDGVTRYQYILTKTP